MVIIGIQHYKISLLAYFDAADTIRPVQGSSPVQGEGSDSFFNSKMHIDACQSKSQRNGTGETTARIEICGKGYGTTGINHFATACIRFFQGKSCKRE